MYWHSFIHASIHSRHHTVTVSMCTVLNTIVRRLNTRVINFSVNVHHQSCLCLCVLCSVWTMKAYGLGLLMRHFFRMSEAMRWSVRTVFRYLPCHAMPMIWFHAFSQVLSVPMSAEWMGMEMEPERQRSLRSCAPYSPVFLCAHAEECVAACGMYTFLKWTN